jgi:hypothetical protein
LGQLIQGKFHKRKIDPDLITRLIRDGGLQECEFGQGLHIFGYLAVLAQASIWSACDVLFIEADIRIIGVLKAQIN